MTITTSKPLFSGNACACGWQDKSENQDETIELPGSPFPRCPKCKRVVTFGSGSTTEEP